MCVWERRVGGVDDDRLFVESLQVCTGTIRDRVLVVREECWILRKRRETVGEELTDQDQ